MGDDYDAFAQYVQDGLHSLHERGVLESHPLTRLLARGGRPLSGRELRRILIDGIEQLKPDQESTYASPGWRRYRLLVLRYVDGRSFDDSCRQLGVSARQAYRDHAGAIGGLVALLWNASSRAEVPGVVEPTRDRPPQPDSDLDVELTRLSVAEEAGPTSVRDVLRDVFDTIRDLARDRQVQLDERLSVNTAPVAVSRTVLRQIVLRLVIYLSEIAPGSRITVEGDTREGRVVLRFRLAARGAAVAEPAEHVRTGLRISERLVHLHGGSLQAHEVAGSLGEIEIGLLPASVPTVLLVDDNPDMVRLYTLYLSSRGYRVVQATNAEGALHLAVEARPNVITLDVLMPSHDGWEVLRELRARPETRAIPVVVCSVVPDLTLATVLGVQGFLLKPVTREKLLAAIEPFMPPTPAAGAGDRASP